MLADEVPGGGSAFHCPVRRPTELSEEHSFMIKRASASCPAILLAALSVLVYLPSANAATPERPHAGKTEIMPVSELKPGMQGTAWTVFSGSDPEPIPVEIIGV